MYYRPSENVRTTNQVPADYYIVPVYTERIYYGYSYDYYLERCPCCDEPVLSGWNYCPFCGCDLRKGERQK